MVSNNYIWLGFFRIAVSLFCISQFVAAIQDYDLIFSENSILLPEITSAESSRYILTIYKIYTTKVISYYLTYNQVLTILAFVYIISLVFVLIGFKTKINALIALFMHYLFINSYSNFTYGVDYYVSICLFYIFIFNSGKFFSLDSGFMTDNKNELSYNSFCLLIIKIHLSISYFFSGFDKLVGFNWRNGESIWKALHLADNPITALNINAIHNPLLFTILGWSVVLIEIFYFIGINWKKTRNLWLILICGLHLGIGIFLGLHFFAVFMIIFNFCIYFIPTLKIEKTEWYFFNNHRNIL